MRHRLSTRVARRGYSLIETLMASTIAALILVPALALMKTSLEVRRDVETAQLLTTLGVGKMEEHLAITAADFQTGNFAGDFSTQGHNSLRFQVARSDSSANGGVTDRLMVITVTVWEDVNSNAVHDSGELSSSFMTKVAKMATYVDQVGGG